MDILLLQDFLAFALGYVTFVLFHLLKVYTKKKTSFRIAHYITDPENLINYGIALASGMGLLFALPELLSEETIQYLTIIAYMVGLMNFELVKMVRKIFVGAINKKSGQ